MDEQTPLLSAGNTNPVSRPFVEHTVPTVSDSDATINCQVCNHVVFLGNREKQMVIRCSNCHEATPVQGPPAGKQYVRCPCNCLLICNANTTKVGCPRPECQKVIVLSEGDADYGSHSDNAANSRAAPGSHSGTRNFGAPQSLRVNCGNCNSPFSVASTPQHTSRRMDPIISCLSCGTAAGAAGLIAARCPHCRKVTSVGPAYARVRFTLYGLLALIMIAIAIAVTVATAEAAKEKKALYFLHSVLYLIAIVLGLRAFVFLRMPTSVVDVQLLYI